MEMLQFSISFSLCLLVGVGFQLFHVAGQELQTVNIVSFHEVNNTMAVFDSAIEFLKNNAPTGVKIGTARKFISNGIKEVELVAKLCKQISEKERPDIAVDFTRAGILSEAVKSVVKILNLPTVSASFGKEGDIRNWKDLEGTNASEYLIQVTPPVHVIFQNLKMIFPKWEISSAVLVLDGNQYKVSHLQDESASSFYRIPKMMKGLTPLGKQIVGLNFYNITNYIIGSSLKSSDLSDITTILSKPIIPSAELNHIHFASLDMNYSSLGERRIFLRTKGLMEMFYFDLTVNSILAVKKLKADGDWIVPKTHLDQSQCENLDAVEFDDNYNLNLYDALRSEGEENILGPFHLDENGLNYPEFEMSSQSFIYGQWATPGSGNSLMNPNTAFYRPQNFWNNNNNGPSSSSRSFRGKWGWFVGAILSVLGIGRCIAYCLHGDAEPEQ